MVGSDLFIQEVSVLSGLWLLKNFKACFSLLRTNIQSGLGSTPHPIKDSLQKSIHYNSTMFRRNPNIQNLNLSSKWLSRLVAYLWETTLVDGWCNLAPTTFHQGRGNSRKLKFLFLEKQNMSATQQLYKPNWPNWCKTKIEHENSQFLDKLICARSCCWRKSLDAVRENLYWMHPHIYCCSTFQYGTNTFSNLENTFCNLNPLYLTIFDF